MNVLEIAALSFGLAMDAAAVALARGVAAPRVRAMDVMSIALYFGGFQAGMPLLGYALGHVLGPLVTQLGGVIAFVLMAGIGAHMLWEAFQSEAHDDAEAHDAFAPRVLLALAVATSIDAFAAGLTLPLLSAPLALSVCAIGITTAVLSAGGLWFGHTFAALLRTRALDRRLDALGGVVLIALAIKLLLTAHGK